MKPCAVINLYVNAENRPTVQFEPAQEYLDMNPIHQAIMAHAGVQIAMAVVKQIIAEYPELEQTISEHIMSSNLEPGMPRPN
jgi:hypothetical protein